MTVFAWYILTITPANPYLHPPHCTINLRTPPKDMARNETRNQITRRRYPYLPGRRWDVQRSKPSRAAPNLSQTRQHRQ
jgi:hypothetical protein